MKLAVTLVVIVVAFANAQKFGQRTAHSPLAVAGNTNYIIGGTEVRPNEFPWQISFQVYTTENRGEPKRWIHKCGGSILNDRWIVTAAHCHSLDNFKNYRVVVGAHYLHKQESTTQTLGVENMIVHAGFDEDTYQDDIAMVKLAGRIHLDSRTAAPVCLPTSADMATFDNGTCVASGWGKTSHGGVDSEKLLKVKLPVVPNSVCERHYSDVAGAEITNSKICAGNLVKDGQGVCKGDSGGPFVCLHNGEYKLAGITSAGVVCGSKDYPAIFTRVSQYRNWIDEIIRKN